ncbi:hypothetical protein [Sulfitobacter sp. 1A15106]|uniref:hypothetical protein n=1 Tax=Sulfitobacter sp. 1A15106 TaxID=3368590 RepID=UPI003746989E
MGKIFTTEELQAAIDWLDVCGSSRAAARESGIPRNTLVYRRDRGLELGMTPSGRDPRHDNLSPEQVEQCEARGIPTAQLRHGWDKDQETGRSYFFKVPQPGDLGATEDHVKAIMAAAHALGGTRVPLSGIEYKGGDHALVLTPADLHFGKLAAAIETGDEYNIRIAEQRTKDGTKALLTMAGAFGLERIILNTGNDGMHTEDGRATTGGTPQDSDVTWHSQWIAAFETWVWVIEEAAKEAPVTVVFTASNHPWRSDWSVNMALAAHFRNDGRVSFPDDLQTPRHRKYMVYGESLLGFTHGDGAKESDLAHLMAFEAGHHFGEAMRGYWITGHLHHKVKKSVGIGGQIVEKDGIGVTVIRPGKEDFRRQVMVEVVRSPSGTDGWHDRKGYVGALKAVEAFMFHVRNGQIARFTHPFY